MDIEYFFNNISNYQYHQYNINLFHINLLKIDILILKSKFNIKYIHKYDNYDKSKCDLWFDIA